MYSDYSRKAYEYTGSVGYDYNYDPADTAQRRGLKFDPYSDNIPDNLGDTGSLSGSQEEQKQPEREERDERTQRPRDRNVSASRTDDSRDHRGGGGYEDRKRYRPSHREPPAKKRRPSPEYTAYSHNDRRSYHSPAYRSNDSSPARHKKQKQRRPSPDYGDYKGRDGDQSPSSTPTYMPVAPRSNASSEAPETKASSNATATTSGYVSPLLRKSSPLVIRPSTPSRNSPRPRTPPPPAPTSPTEEYIQTSQEPSLPLDDPTLSRKLLILDLNGTLVFRSPHKKREKPRNRWNSRPQQPDMPSSPPLGEASIEYTDAYADPSAIRPLRTVHSRPYLKPFREYLFHPKTRAWLDTMVWSSAQPHSVGDMVDRCFGEWKDGLVAVWARDTLGLSEADYNRKTQTTKDLAKPWAALPLKSSSDAPAEPDKDPKVASKHSAQTTLLLDDSPLKAHLQPWNHLCIREYVAEMRQADALARDGEVMAIREAKEVQAAEAQEIADAAQLQDDMEAQEVEEAQNAQDLKETAERETEERETEQALLEKSASRSPEIQRKGEVDGVDEVIAERHPSDPIIEADVPESETVGVTLEEAEGDEANKKKRKRERKKKKKNGIKIPGLHGEPKYDKTLLAIIGVLESIKGESNVAGWMRSGGLLKGVYSLAGADGKDAADTSLDMESVEARAKRRKLTEGVDVGNEVEGTVPGRPSSPPTIPPTSELSIGDERPSSPAAMDVVDIPSENTTQAVFDSETLTGIPMSDDPPGLNSASIAAAAASSAPSSSLSPTIVATTSSPSKRPSISVEDEANIEHKPHLWFEDAAALDYWAARGVKALEELDIEVESGVTGSLG